MSMEGSSTNHMLSGGGASIAPSTFYIYWLSYRCSFALECNCKTCGKVCVNLKTFTGVIDSDSDSLLFENALVVCWYVIHSQSLTLTSDDLIWSSCGDYYDRTSIVMKIIQKASELWTAITGHESQQCCKMIHRFHNWFSQSRRRPYVESAYY